MGDHTISGALSKFDKKTQEEILKEAFLEKPKLLFLDDRSKRLHAALKKYGEEYDVTLVCTVKECIKMLSNDGPWEVISLDHDLDYEEFVPSLLPNTGMEVVRWLCENVEYMFKYQSVPEKIILHSSNRAASWSMYMRLKNDFTTPLIDMGLSKMIYLEIKRFTYDEED